MKIYHTLCLGAVIALAPSALAQLPITNDVFGQAEGMIDFCSKVNPKAVPQYQAREKALVGNATDADEATARSSQTYKDSFSLLETVLKKLPKNDVAKICTDLAAGQ